MRAWAKDAGTRPIALDDAEAELSLRGVELPLDLVDDEIAAVIKGADGILASAGQAIDQASTRITLRNTP